MALKILACVLCALLLFGCILEKEDGILVRVSADGGEVAIGAEVADSQAEHARGLMWRRSLAEDRGMLFLFSHEALHAFWMKNTLIPLDMVFISENMEIVDIIQNVQPCKNSPCPSYIPLQNAKYVLEVNGGYCEKNGIGIGNRVEFGAGNAG